MHRPRSTIYNEPETGVNLSDRLTSSKFDRSKPSRRRKLERVRKRNEAVRGQPGVRVLGKHKVGDYGYQKL